MKVEPPKPTFTGIWDDTGTVAFKGNDSSGEFTGHNFTGATFAFKFATVTTPTESDWMDVTMMNINEQTRTDTNVWFTCTPYGQLGASWMRIIATLPTGAVGTYDYQFGV